VLVILESDTEQTLDMRSGFIFGTCSW